MLSAKSWYRTCKPLLATRALVPNPSWLKSTSPYLSLNGGDGSSSMGCSSCCWSFASNVSSSSFLPGSSLNFWFTINRIIYRYENMARKASSEGNSYLPGTASFDSILLPPLFFDNSFLGVGFPDLGDMMLQIE